MSEAARVPAFRRQAAGLPRHHAVVGRESRGLDIGHKFFEEVWADHAGFFWKLMLM